MSGRVSGLDLVDDVATELATRPARSVLTGLGTVLGVGFLVAVLGLTATARAQIDERFNEQTASRVTVKQDDRSDPTVAGVPAFPADAVSRLTAIQGVTNAAVHWSLPAVQVYRDLAPGAEPVSVPVAAVTPTAFDTAAAVIVQGRAFDGYAEGSAARVAMLGASAARSLQIADVSAGPAILLDGIPFTVVGIIGGTGSDPELLTEVVVPAGTARAVWGEPVGKDQQTSAWVNVDRGAARVVAGQVAYALNPANPDRFEVVAPPGPETLRAVVGDDLQSAFAALAGLCLLAGVVSIANATYVSVLERRSEIGLRRALGARQHHIAFLFLLEATVIGLVGGLVGGLGGLTAVVVTSIARDWTAVMPTGVLVLGPLLGAATGLAAGLIPAIRAARTEPITALRSAG